MMVLSSHKFVYTYRYLLLLLWVGGIICGIEWTCIIINVGPIACESNGFITALKSLPSFL